MKQVTKTLQHSQGMPQHTVYLGVGSNIGDRAGHLRAALAALAADVEIERLSSVYDTPPLLVTNQPRFYNLVCQGLTILDPFPLLRVLKDIEKRLGRTPGLRYGPRVIDLDLLFYDQLVYDAPELTLPHPRIPERAFVLVPLAEVAPHLRHPALHVSVSDLLSHVTSEGIVNLGPLSLLKS